MDLLNKTKAVKLRSHLDKYLIADKNRTTIRQTRTITTTNNSIWLIEYSSPTTLRFKNHATGLYLAATHSPFLLGFTGKKVIQSPLLLTSASTSASTSTSTNSGFIFDWEPIRDGFQVKLKTSSGGKFLRANGGMPPWRNTVTHDVPVRGVSCNWTLWDVEPIESLSDQEEMEEMGDGFWSVASSFAPSDEDEDVDDEFALPSPTVSYQRSLVVSDRPSLPPILSINKVVMEFFTNAKAIRLQSHHGKYLTADKDRKSVKQTRDGSSFNACWTIEFIESGNHIIPLIRLKSCYGTYLSASNRQFLLGMTGRKVHQTIFPPGEQSTPGPHRNSKKHSSSSTVEWEPVPENVSGQFLLKLKNPRGNFLRANSGPPPWKNSVTHDVPHKARTQDWILWRVDIVEIWSAESNFCGQRMLEAAPRTPTLPVVKAGSQVVPFDSFGSDSECSSLRLALAPFSDGLQFDDSPLCLPAPPPKLDAGRLIYYHIADENGHVSMDAVEGCLFPFKGTTVEDLAHKLEEETGIENPVVCSRNPLNGMLYPLRLHLPPNNSTMRVLVVQSNSRVARGFEPEEGSLCLAIY